MLYFLLSTLVLTLYIDVVLSLSIGCSLELAIPSAFSAENGLANVCGFSPNQLVSDYEMFTVTSFILEIVMIPVI